MRVVARVRSGDRQAFGELYRWFGRAVHGVLLARLPHHEAEDLVQDVFLHALEHLRELREPASFGGWICAIARRRAADHYRAFQPTDPLIETASSTDPPERTAEARLALAAIRELPEAYRETLVLRLVEGHSGTEIARLTGLTPGSVRVNLHRGFRLLRQKLGIDP